MELKNYSKVGDQLPIPDLVAIQRASYEAFLQADVQPGKRKSEGLQAILEETFPIISPQGDLKLEFLRYELGKPRFSPDKCRQLRLTYGRPLRVYLRLFKEQPVEEDVYLGDLPIMMGGGEFIINGAERVIVTQLHRSPGVDFIEDTHAGERRMHSCRIIPERGSWIEMNVNKRDVLTVRIDQSGKIIATMFIRALSKEYSSSAAILRLFYETEKVKITPATAEARLRDCFLVEPIIDKGTQKALVPSGVRITPEVARTIIDADVSEVEVIRKPDDLLVLNTLAEDRSTSHEDALVRLYGRLRPGNPQDLERAQQLFRDKFFDPNRYRLGTVGRFRLNRKFDQDIPMDEMTLRPEDVVNCVRYLVKLRQGEGQLDDIDHLGNRRLRTIGELAAEELRKGFLKLKRTVQERMNLKDPDQATPRTLVNSKTISSAIDYFFGRGELSQVVDQTNPLSQLTHERRLSALGPGGLNRKRAGFEVRDVHISHYGRICPIETPEGTNIGLIASLGIYSTVDQYGFLTTPYMEMKNGKATGKIRYLRADEEDNHFIMPADAAITRGVGKTQVLARKNGEFYEIDPKEVEYMDIAPKQIVGVSASLIPFLEHSDANRALMGSNMQRQAVPLLRTEAPIVQTGMEKAVAENSSMVVKAEAEGVVTYVDATTIRIKEKGTAGEREYRLRKFAALNEGTCLNQKPIVTIGQKVNQGQIIADGAATHQGVLALGRNALVAFMTWDGYNFEDAIVVSEKLVREDRYTSIHIDVFDVEVRETKLGREELTRDIPNVSEKMLRNLDESGVIRVGTHVKPDDILVGKVSPKSRTELTPEEKLLYAIFGKAGEDVKNDSLTVPSGVEGVVIGVQRFARRSQLGEDKRKELNRQTETIEAEYNEKIAAIFRETLLELEKINGGPLNDTQTRESFHVAHGVTTRELVEMESRFQFDNIDFGPKKRKEKAQEIYKRANREIQTLKEEREQRLNDLRLGDELQSGVLELVKVYIATKRVLSVGDKMAGRHGNKGVIAKIVPEEDMPFMPDGTTVEIVLNPLGVPSRMNIGQILETHLGWAAKKQGFIALTPVFDGATEEEIREALRQAGLPESGKAVLYDGRTGEPFEQEVTVGYMYMMKLHHLVEDKVHARATGPYSLITQQPLGGKARFGGQRFGEMEVWALEAYGAAYILQELLTVKSDDVEGRNKIYESMIKGENALEACTPVSFEVLCNEIRGLGLNIEPIKRKL